MSILYAGSKYKFVFINYITIYIDASTHMISFTTLMRLHQHTSLIMLKGLFTNIEKFVSSHYKIPPTFFLSVMKAQASIVIHVS